MVYRLGVSSGSIEAEKFCYLLYAFEEKLPYLVFVAES